MGSCFDKQPQHEEPSSLLVERKPKLKRPAATKSGLLMRSISKEIIQEEDSKILQGSYVSALSGLENSSDASGIMLVGKSSKVGSRQQATLLDFQRQNPVGPKIFSNQNIIVKNVATERYLHSHAIKTQNNKLYDICACDSGSHEHDWWSFIVDVDGMVMDGTMVMLHHKLTRSMMQSSKRAISVKTKEQSVFGSQQSQDEDNFWVVELVNNSDSSYLKLNSLFRLKHLCSEGYLHSGKARGILSDVYEVSVCYHHDLMDVWFVSTVEEQ